jgi:hypothetical protein
MGTLWSASAIVAVLISNYTFSRSVSIRFLRTPLVLSAFLRWLNIRGLSSAIKRRDLHNNYLTEYIKSRSYILATPRALGTREVDLRTLQFVQWFIEIGLLPADDWSRHTMVDQFQTAALRYQLRQSTAARHISVTVYLTIARVWLTLARSPFVKHGVRM